MKLTVKKSNNVSVVRTVEEDDIAIVLYQSKCNEDPKIWTD